MLFRSRTAYQRGHEGIHFVGAVIDQRQRQKRIDTRKQHNEHRDRKPLRIVPVNATDASLAIAAQTPAARIEASVEQGSQHSPTTIRSTPTIQFALVRRSRSLALRLYGHDLTFFQSWRSSPISIVAVQKRSSWGQNVTQVT